MELMPFMQKIKAHLDEVAQKDKTFAKSYAKENKSLGECEKYILQEVRRQAKGKSAVGCDDDDIYNLAIHYYDEDDIKVDGAKPNVQVAHTPDKPAAKKSQKKQKTQEPQKTKNEEPDEYEPMALEIPLFG